MPAENLAILQKAYYKSLARTTYLYDRLSGILELARDVDIRVVLLKAWHWKAPSTGTGASGR